jgi:hypothetical protein
MNLDDAQKMKISAWINEGLKLADIQKRIGSEFGLNPTYMEVRLLVDDLKLTPKDASPPAVPTKLAPESPVGNDTLPGGKVGKPGLNAGAPEGARGAGGVSVAIDAVSRPGALVSGSVKFSDGQSGSWYLDQMGRLGVVPSQQGYKPAPADVQAFQEALERELTKLGL